MDKLYKIILKRLGMGLITLLVVSIIIFTSVELLPGDIAETLLGQTATKETLDALREKLGLNVPAPIRYIQWLMGVLKGDFGSSLATGRDIFEIIGPRLNNTMFLALMTASISVPIALALGILTALYRNSLFDRIVNLGTLTTISFPEFFVAYILIILLAINSQYFPAISNIAPDVTFGERIYLSFLPALTLTLVVTAHTMRMTRAAIINLLALPYIEMARLKGASPLRVIVYHALPNAIAPIANVVALTLAFLITSVVLVEVVFVYPGLGQLLVDSVAKRDIPLVQASCLFFAAAYILLNLIADVVVIASNPRLLHPE